MVVGEHLDEGGDLDLGARGDREPRQSRAPRAEGQQQQIMTLLDVRALVRDHGDQLIRVEAVDAPRWLLGRTWGDDTDSLKLEGRFPEETRRKLEALGHEVEMVEDFDEIVGHAGGIARDSNGVFEGGSDPRSNGAVAGF